MQEFIAVFISFTSILVLNKKKVPVGLAICICALLMAFIGGLEIPAITEVLVDTFTNLTKVKQYIIITEVSIIGILLGKYGIIDEVIKYFSKIVSSRRITLMSIPALVGLLSVPGGAIISAPFVDKLGDKSNLSKTHKAVINLVYRHIAMHIMPYTSGFLLVASLAPSISVYKLAGLNSIFVILYCIIGYFLYIHKVKKDRTSSNKASWSSLINLLIHTSPVYVAVLLNLFVGLPFYYGLLFNLLIIFLLRPIKSFPIDIIKSINYKILFALIGVYLIQGVIGKMESLTDFLTMIFSSPDTIIFGIIVISFFFGMTTGFQPTALGIVLPILTMLPLTESQLLFYAHFTFEWSFVGYFFSPLHLCQLFTCEYLDVSTAELYKEYWKLFLSLIAVLMVNYFILGIWLNH
jgi:uncharacterized protein